MKILEKFDWVPIAIAALATRIIPFFIYGTHPLGYDTGFYRHYVTQEFVSFPNSASAGLGISSLLPRLLLDTLRLLNIPPDSAIYGVLIGAFTCTALAFQLVIKKRCGKKAGIIAGLLFVFSSVQYAGYWFFLLKNYVALFFLFLIFNRLEKGDIFRLAIYITLVFLSHITTSIVLIFSVFIFFIIFLFEKKEWNNVMSIVVIGGLSILFLALSNIWQKIDWHTTGIFLDWSQYLHIGLPALLLMLYAIPIIGRKVLINPFFSLLAISLPITIFMLTFYERMFLFLDIAAIALTTEGIAILIHASQKMTRATKLATIAVATLLCGWYVGNFTVTVKKYAPIVTREEITEIKKIDVLTEKNSTILTVSDYMPWVYGFTHRNVISPGLLERTYNLEKWREFWFEMNEKEKESFLQAFPQPLYFFADPRKEIFLTGKCTKKKTDHLIQFACK